ncbi:hypothetical protein HYW21_01990 [Candidatus Woesearchaeota archaeon]|nr:hypothetical protein [Candidatus Woesearchaeota archaeon]
MVSVTLSLPQDVKEKMKQFPEMNWSGFIRKTILEKVEQLEWKEKMLKQVKKDHEISEWAIELVKPNRRERLKELQKKGWL